MYGTCGRIDNKADFDFDFDVTPLLFCLYAFLVFFDYGHLYVIAYGFSVKAKSFVLLLGHLSVLF